MQIELTKNYLHKKAEATEQRHAGVGDLYSLLWLNDLNILQFSLLMLFKSIVFKDDHDIVEMGESTQWMYIQPIKATDSKHFQMLSHYHLIFQNDPVVRILHLVQLSPCSLTLLSKHQGSVQWYFCCSSSQCSILQLKSSNSQLN